MTHRPAVLIVDDEAAIQLLLRDELEEAGYDVEIARDGGSAETAMSAREFDVVLLDKNLPDVDGVDLLKKMRQSGSEVEVIIMTGFASLESALRAMEHGIFDYVTKPFDYVKGVVQRVGRAVEKRRQHTTLRSLIVQLARSSRQLGASMETLRAAYLELAGAVSQLAGVYHPELIESRERIAELAVATAREFGVEASMLDYLRMAVLVRAIPGNGSADDAAVPGADPLGAAMLSAVSELQPVVRVLSGCTERFDGSGIPSGLLGKQIPLGARILAAVDGYVERAPDDEPQSTAAALAALDELAGSQLDPEVVSALRAVVVRRGGEG